MTSMNASVALLSLRAVGVDLKFAEQSPGAFNFSLPRADNYFLEFSGLEYYVHIWVDEIEGIDPPAGNAVVSVVESGCKPNTKQACTSLLQQLMSDIAGGRSNKSTVYFPAGEYLTDSLFITGTSGLRIHLDPGAVLRYKAPVKSTSTSDLLVGHAGTANPLPGFLTFDAAGGVNITGRGTIDVNAFHVLSDVDNAHGLYLHNSTDIHVDDIHIMGSAGWAIPIRLCHRVTFTNVRLFSGCDGFDPGEGGC
jgi:polygalacturonase